MFVGHGLAAFAVVGAVCRWRGIDTRRTLQLAFVAALFATLPDVDILYGPIGLLNGFSGIFDATSAFWSTGNVVHRGPTHSMVFGAIAASAFALWHRKTTVARSGAIAALVTLVAVATVYSGFVAGIVTIAMALVGLLIVAFTRRWDFTARGVFATALVGLLSHPLGDLFTGEPPTLLYPFDVVLVPERIVLSQDPTLHLLAAFAIELSIIWFAVGVYTSLTDQPIVPLIDRRAILGVVYAGAAVALPAPTLETSYHFVFSVLAVGSVGATRRKFRSWRRTVATGLSAITLALLAYTVTYLLL